MKRILIYLLLFSVLLAFASCHNSEDPFTESMTENGDFSEPAGNSTSPQARPDIEEGFYSLSASEAYQKYGLFASDINALKACDGEHIYVTGADQILYRSDYPSGENQRPVCTDPLCTHKPGSSCPLGNIGSMFGLACYADNLFYIGIDGVLYTYSPETNSSRTLLKNCSKATFQKYCGKLYLINPEEDKDFKSVSFIYQITKNAGIKRIGSVNERFEKSFFVHSDHTVVGFRLDNDSDEFYVSVVLYDFVSDKSKTVYEHLFTEIKGKENAKADIVAMSIFGDKVLYSVRYSYQTSDETTELSEIWLTDVITGEKRLLTTIHSLQESFYCLFSEKYICVSDWRDDETSPYVIHVLDPYSGGESVYDLSKMAAETGETIPVTDCHMSALNRFALVLNKSCWIPYTAVNDEGKEYTAYRLNTVKYLAFDLESGRVKKYPEPDPSDET